jgi:predicted metal-dependent hydrolase
MITTKQQPQSLILIKMRNFLKTHLSDCVRSESRFKSCRRKKNKSEDWAQYYAEEYLLKGEKTGMFEVNGHAVAVSINLRKVYQYPDELTKLEEELKRRKKESELNGTAKLIAVNRYLVFKF